MKLKKHELVKSNWFKVSREIRNKFIDQRKKNRKFNRIPVCRFSTPPY